MQISTKSSVKFADTSATRLSTKNAWAKYVQGRWQVNGVKYAMAEWGLTEGEAKGLWAAQASQPTIDKILDHPRGGFGLGLLILEIKVQTRLLHFLESEKARLKDEALRAIAEVEAMDRVASYLPAIGRVEPMRGVFRGVERRRQDAAQVR